MDDNTRDFVNITGNNGVLGLNDGYKGEMQDLVKDFDLNIDKSQISIDEILKEGNEEIERREKLMFEPQSISLFRIYRHFFEQIDYLFAILGIIGGLASGVCTPLLFFFSSDNFSKIGNTEEISDIQAPPQIIQMILDQRNKDIRESMDENIRRQLIVGAIAFVSNFMNLSFWYLIGNRTVHKLKKSYFSILLSQEQGWFDAFNTYELANKVLAQIEQVEYGIGIKVGICLFAISQCLTGFIVAFISYWKVTLIMICIAPFAILIYFIISNTLRKGIIIGRKTWEVAGGIAKELIYNIKTVASFANFEYELRRIYEKIEIVWMIETMNALKLGILNGIVVFLLYLDLFICYSYGRTLIKKDVNYLRGRDVTGADIFSAGLCTLIGISSIPIIGPNFKIIQESCSAASDYFNIYHRKPQMDLSQSIQRPPISQIQGKIEFHGVNFYYPSDPEQRLILNDLNIAFEPGKKIALVGESGSGKSTTVNLIERLYDITGGKLLIDGIEIDKYDLEYLRNMIGYVHQEPVLFNKSIRENIIFGREEYLSSIGNIDELVQNACDESFSSEFINKLSEGLDYIVGIKGNKLSGGQKQRIAIARAILTRPKILILDEATSSLDYISEKEVQTALDNISLQNTTTIIIAHRLSTIKNADLIYVMKNGKILEQGKHEELLQNGGYYSGLINTQLAQEEIGKLEEDQNLTRSSSGLQKKKKSDNEEIEFENKDNALSLSEHDISVNPCVIFTELKDYKLDIFLACLGAVAIGVVVPFLSYFKAKTIYALNSDYQTKRYDDGLKYSLIFLSFSVILAFCNCLMVWKFMFLGLTLAKIYRRKLIEKYLSFHIAYFDVTRNSPGSLLTRMSINTMELNHLLNTILGVTLKCIIIVIVSLAIGLPYDYRLMLINFAFIPVIIISNLIRRQLIETSGKRSVMAQMEAGGILSECILNTKTIYSFNFQRKAILMYLEALKYIRKRIVRDSIIMGFFMGLSAFCYFAANACVYFACKTYMTDGSMGTLDMSVIMNLCNNCVSHIVASLGDLGNIRKAAVAYKLIYSTLKTESLIPPFPADNQGKQAVENIQGKIEFRNVSFAYPTRPENIILKHVNLTIQPGQQVAIVGPSGSGKSTIIQLLNRFYDVDEGKGEILIDDINIKDYNLYELRKKIGYVSQEPSIFKTSLLENIRYGKLSASDGECIEAAKKANIMSLLTEEKVNMLKNIENKNKDSKNENDNISGGEKQRICIARTFLKNPTILLLDEPTSSLDNKSELEVQKSIDQLSTDRTCINVSHKLNTIENCDQIFVMENGRVVENGTHSELMNLKKMYYTLYKYS